MSEYSREMTYGFDLIRAGGEEVPPLDGGRVASALLRLRDKAVDGDGVARVQWLRACNLLDVARERKRRVDGLRKRLRV